MRQTRIVVFSKPAYGLGKLEEGARVVIFMNIQKNEKGYFFILLFLDEKKQKSTDCTELAKNPKLTLKSINSAHKVRCRFDMLEELTLLLISKGDRFLTCSESSPDRFFNALTADFIDAKSVMSGNTDRPLYVSPESPAMNYLPSTGMTE
ncbi:MAG: hypothetical protein AB1598_13505 [Thermodesulfobacteriota bacterium]